MVGGLKLGAKDMHCCLANISVQQRSAHCPGSLGRVQMDVTPPETKEWRDILAEGSAVPNIASGARDLAAVGRTDSQNSWE